MFGFVPTTRLHEEEKRNEELERTVDKLRPKAEECDAMERGFEAALDTLPKLPKQNYDEVVTLSEPHVAYKTLTNSIATLIIPHGATVVFPTEEAQNKEGFTFNSKYRTDRVRTVQLSKIDKSGMYGAVTGLDAGLTTFDKSGYYAMATEKYTVGSQTTPDSFDTNTAEVCSNGIHVFPRKEHAEMWAMS